jgi:hypothetical protein
MEKTDTCRNWVKESHEELIELANQEIKPATYGTESF